MKEEITRNEDGTVASDEKSMSRHNVRMQSTRTNAAKQGSMTTAQGLQVPTPVDINSMRFLVVDEAPNCVLHPAESETFQRSVLDHCFKASEALFQVAAIWMELVTLGVPQSECIVEIGEKLPELSASEIRLRIHRIRALAVDLLESQLIITDAS